MKTTVDFFVLILAALLFVLAGVLFFDAPNSSIAQRVNDNEVDRNFDQQASIFGTINRSRDIPVAQRPNTF